MKNDKTSADKKYSKRNILLSGIIIVSVGIIIMLWSSNINNRTLYDSTNTNSGSTIHWVNFLSNLGSLIITIGFGTALYSYFDFINYVKSQLKEVVIEYGFTDFLSDDKKEKLVCKLQKELTKQNEENDLYDFVQTEILTLTNSAHYEKFYLLVECDRDDDRIIKNITEDYVVNCINDNNFNIGNCCKIKLGSMKDNKCIVSIKELIVNEQRYSEDDYEDGKTKDRAQQVYNQQNILELKQKTIEKIIEYGKTLNNNSKYSIQLKTKTDVTIHDCIYVYRLYRPSKKTTFTFKYNSKEFDVLDSLFTFKDFDMLNNKSEGVRILRGNGIIQITIEEWILPGDGIIFILSPKR